MGISGGNIGGLFGDIARVGPVGPVVVLQSLIVGVGNRSRGGAWGGLAGHDDAVGSAGARPVAGEVVPPAEGASPT